ncbi:transcriptional regulator [Herbaspirillum sp. CF444]|uniref:FCD domain-containing protein n=1 Tax=Herbaspirillum sp. CF444 TaxID=1144319 RepID=UPI00027246A3|nr:FCD domain-containing protein [Herbaspirillum sp. CF444]EJL81233.1 transcriptional regulator [Herbaspirillum sp. CF444]
MPIEAIEPQRLYRQISDQLRKLIVDGEFPVGSRLPSERDLSVQLGVSRPSLREALIALEVEGYIEVHMGSGIYVCPPSPAPEGEIDLSTEEGPLELIRARAMLEGEVAYAAAKNGKKAQIDAIEEAFRQMIEHTSAGTNPLEADRLFHIRVAEATGNSVLVGLVTQLFDARLGPLFNRLHSHFDTIEVWNDAIEEHSRVMKALRARDPEMARAAMRRHMDIAFKRYSASLVGQAGLSSKKVVAEKTSKVAKAKLAVKKPAAKEGVVKVAIRKSAKPATVKKTSAVKAPAKRASVASPPKRRSARA